VNPDYTSAWGDQHWRKPYKNVTRHEAAATVMGRRAQGHKARRREGVTRARPEDHAVRATNQAEAAFATATAAALLGAGRSRAQASPLLGTEDFSLTCPTRCPARSCYRAPARRARIRAPPPSNHSPAAVFDDGTALDAELPLRRFNGACLLA